MPVWLSGQPMNLGRSFSQIPQACKASTPDTQMCVRTRESSEVQLVLCLPCFSLSTGLSWVSQHMCIVSQSAKSVKVHLSSSTLSFQDFLLNLRLLYVLLTPTEAHSHTCGAMYFHHLFPAEFSVITNTAGFQLCPKLICPLWQHT